MYDVIIIGKGPAGISAALYIKRANISVLVIGKDEGALKKAEKIENYYGITGTGKEIFENGIMQAVNLGIEIKEEEVVSISYDQKFIIKTNKEKYESKAVLLATGANRAKTKIKGIEEFEGKGISYCATCDGFLYRGKDVAVLGNGKYALSEAKELLQVAKTVTILTNGRENHELKNNFDDRIRINNDSIKQFVGDNIINGIIFENNSMLPISGVFVAEGVATSVDFARKLGVKIEKSRIVVNSRMETNLKGLYAAGDCTGGLLQISKAVADGAISGTEIVKFIREN